MKDFNSFDEMMEDQEGARPEDFAIPWGDKDFEIVNDYIAIYAHGGSKEKAIKFAQENNLFVLTETIGDNEEDETSFSYCRGFAWINRERYFFTRKNDDFFFDEVV
jgi:hypothetical protein